jgi:hypothetical protein
MQHRLGFIACEFSRNNVPKLEYAPTARLFRRQWHCVCDYRPRASWCDTETPNAELSGVGSEAVALDHIARRVHFAPPFAPSLLVALRTIEQIASRVSADSFPQAATISDSSVHDRSDGGDTVGEMPDFALSHVCDVAPSCVPSGHAFDSP